MQENQKLLIAALVVLLGGNAGSFINAIDPHVRSDPFTGSDWLEGKAELQRLCRENTANLQRQIDVHNTQRLAEQLEYEHWKEEHIMWGRELSGRNNARFEEIYRRLP